MWVYAGEQFVSLLKCLVQFTMNTCVTFEEGVHVSLNESFFPFFFKAQVSSPCES